MISLSKGVLFVVDLGHIESFVVIILGTTGCKPLAPSAVTTQKRVRKHVQHVNNMYKFPNVREVLVKDVNISPTPLMIIRQDVQRVYMFRNGSTRQGP